MYYISRELNINIKNNNVTRIACILRSATRLFSSILYNIIFSSIRRTFVCVYTIIIRLYIYYKYARHTTKTLVCECTCVLHDVGKKNSYFNIGNNNQSFSFSFPYSPERKMLRNRTDPFRFVGTVTVLIYNVFDSRAAFTARSTGHRVRPDQQSIYEQGLPDTTIVYMNRSCGGIDTEIVEKRKMNKNFCVCTTVRVYITVTKTGVIK